MTDPEANSDAANAALRAEGAFVREFIQASRSPTLLGLFDYLLEQTLQGRRPKEIEIAEVVFLESIEGASGQGSRVRVGIHRLRKRLEGYYEGRIGPRIVIPQGEYALQLVAPSQAGESGEDGRERRAESQTPAMSSLWLAALVLVLGNLAMAGFYFSDRSGFGHHAVKATLWQGFGPEQPTTLVTGDYFMFLNKGKNAQDDEVMQDLSINNPDDFYQRMSIDPTFQYQLMPGNSYTVTTETLGTVSALWPVIKPFDPAPITSSQLNPDIMKTSALIYVGAIDGLSPLIAGPLFQASHFKCTDTCYELVHKTTGKNYLAASPYLLRDQIVPRQDFGYIASFPGPSGKQIVVLSGTGEAGVKQMVALAAGDRNGLRDLAKRLGGKFESFEALYQVRTMFSQSYQSTLLVAQPLDMSKVWDRTKAMEQYSATRPAAS